MRHTRTVTNVAFSPDSTRLATASWDGSARVWDARTGAPLTPLLMHDGHVTDAAFSPDGRRVVTASRDMMVRLWDAASGQPLSGPLRHDAPVEQVRFEPGGECIVASTASAAHFWDMPDFPTPPPEWLAPLAEMVSLCERPADPATGVALIAKYEQTRATAMSERGDDAYAILARRLFGAPFMAPAPK